MKKVKHIVLSTAAAGSLLMSGTAMAGASWNLGYTSDYVFRGIYQAASSASAGADYDFGNGFAVGIWGADVDNGIEYDLYGSYSGEAAGFSYSVGFTTYNYTEDDPGTGFDDTYTEFNLNGGYGPISVEYSAGTYDNFGGPEQDYSFTAVTLEHMGAYAKFGSFGKDFDGSYVELGYGKEIGGFDVGIALIDNDEKLDTHSPSADGETILTLSLGKSFDL